jgi:UDP-glucose 4-epimerase
MKSVLITGGCGFVAGRIAELLSSTYHVTVVDNMRYWGTDAVIPRGCEFIQKNIGDSFPLEHYDYIIHGATVNIIHAMTDPRACVDTNFTQTLDFFDRIPKETPVLYLSTSSVYGNGVIFPTPETCRVAPSNPYAMTKLLAEQYLLEHHPRAIIARLSNVYGPRQRPENAYSGVMVKLLQSAIQGKVFKIYGNGMQTRDYTYVDDVVMACSLLMTSGHYGEVFNIGTGIETTVNQLLKYLPEGVDVEYVEGRVIDNVVRRCLDIRKIKMAVGWEPRVTLDHGVPSAMAWLTGV